MNTTNATFRTNTSSATRMAPRATALTMAFTVTLLMFGGIDGLAHAPEAGSLLAAAPAGVASPDASAAAASRATTAATPATTATATATAKAPAALSPRG